MEAKSETLHVRVTPTDLERLQWAAEQVGLPTATFVRRSLRAVALKELSAEKPAEEAL